MKVQASYTRSTYTTQQQCKVVPIRIRTGSTSTCHIAIHGFPLGDNAPSLRYHILQLPRNNGLTSLYYSESYDKKYDKCLGKTDED